MKILHLMSWAWAIGTLVLLAYIGWTFYTQWQKEAGKNTWQRMIAASRDSLTILTAKLTAIVGIGVGFLDQIADLLNAPEAKDFINTWIGNPKIISAIMLTISALVWRARLRSMSPTVDAPLPPKDPT